MDLAVNPLQFPSLAGADCRHSFFAGWNEREGIISLGQSPVNGFDNIHSLADNISNEPALEITLLKRWTTKLEMPIIPAASPE